MILITVLYIKMKKQIKFLIIYIYGMNMQPLTITFTNNI